MSESSTPRSLEDAVPAQVVAAPLVARGLGFRDLQRAIFLMAGLFLAWRMAAPLTTLMLCFLLVFILAAVINPVAVKLQRRGIPRIVSALGIVLGLLTLLGLLGWLALPPLMEELGTFFRKLPEKQGVFTNWYNELLTRYPWAKGAVPAPDQIGKNLGPNLNNLLGQVGRYTMNLAVGVLSFLILLVLVIYTVAHPGPLITGLLCATPERHRERMAMALRRILEQLKNWAFGSLMLGGIIGLMTAIGLWGLGQVLRPGEGFPYILLFSVIAAIGEMIPSIGPIVSAFPPILVALTIDPALGLAVAILFIVIQQLENNLIVPLVMGQTLNFHPVSIIFAVLVMGALFGLFGAILAMPVAAIIKVFWEEFYLAPTRTNAQALQRVADDIVGSGSPNRKDSSPVQHAVEAATADPDAEPKKIHSSE